jgi:hypothetical protein
MFTEREANYRFCCLKYHQKLSILISLGIMKDEYEGKMLYNISSDFYSEIKRNGDWIKFCGLVAEIYNRRF